MSLFVIDQLPHLTLLSSLDWKDYELLDSGNGLRLERFGPYCLVRPEADAIWQPALPDKEWKSAHAVFTPSPEENGGHWQFNQDIPKRWGIDYKGMRFWAQLSASRHVGVFPEQAAEWDWISEQVQSSNRPLKVLNLFGYTALATLAAARSGAQVTHVDASPKVISWAKENQVLSGLDNLSIRWMVDDALKFVLREGRRKSHYDGIILDPPKFGRGPKGEVWEFYKLIPELLAACRQILSPNPRFILMTAYAVKASALTLSNAIQEMMIGKAGETTAGELVLLEKSAGRVLSMAVYCAWSAIGRPKKHTSKIIKGK
jgi:23S rRNA (cytosine1962-C5)-methyltransferase